MDVKVMNGGSVVIFKNVELRYDKHSARYVQILRNGETIARVAEHMVLREVPPPPPAPPPQPEPEIRREVGVPTVDPPKPKKFAAKRRDTK